VCECHGHKGNQSFGNVGWDSVPFKLPLQVVGPDLLMSEQDFDESIDEDVRFH
jgi:hypothetical protein